jgi:hypothetical protein
MDALIIPCGYPFGSDASVRFTKADFKEATFDLAVSIKIPAVECSVTSTFRRENVLGFLNELRRSEPGKQTAVLRDELRTLALTFEMSEGATGEPFYISLTYQIAVPCDSKWLGRNDAGTSISIRGVRAAAEISSITRYFENLITSPELP